MSFDIKFWNKKTIENFTFKIVSKASNYVL